MAKEQYWIWIKWAPQADFWLAPGQTKTTSSNVNANQNPNTVQNTIPRATSPQWPDLSGFAFWAKAAWENALDGNYLNMRNIALAWRLAWSWVTKAQWIQAALRNMPWFKDASPEDQANTVKTIFGLIQDGTANDKTMTSLADNFNTNYARNPWVANRFQAVLNDYWQASKSQNQILDFFNQYEKAIDPYLNNYADANQKIWEDIVWKLNGLKDQFTSQYWPEGEQRKRMSDYYSSVADVLANEQVNTANEIDAQARQSWASLWATRNARNQALQNNLKLATEYKSKEVADYDNLYKTLNEYLKWYIEAYGNSQDKYVKDTYAKLLEFKNGLWSALLQTQAQLEELKIQDALQQAARTGISLKDT